MADFDIVGERVFEWLNHVAADEWAQLIGCGLDDGLVDEPWVIREVQRDAFEVVAQDGKTAKRLPWSVVRKGCLVVPGDRGSVRTTIENGRPAELIELQQVRQRVRQLGFDPARFGSQDDLRTVDRIVSGSQNDGSIPDRAERYIVYEAVVKAQQLRPAIPVFGRWLTSIEKRRHPEVDPIARLQLSTLYRHSGQLNEALEVSDVVDLPARRFPATARERSMLCCHRAATMLDLFEINGDARLLEGARRHLSTAWDNDKGEEVSNTYSRYRRLQERAEAGEDPTRPWNGRT